MTRSRTGRVAWSTVCSSVTDAALIGTLVALTSIVLVDNWHTRKRMALLLWKLSMIEEKLK